MEKKMTFSKEEQIAKLVYYKWWVLFCWYGESNLAPCSCQADTCATELCPRPPKLWFLKGKCLSFIHIIKEKNEEAVIQRDDWTRQGLPGGFLSVLLPHSLAFCKT